MQITHSIIETHIFRRNGKKLQFLLIQRAQHKIYPLTWQMVSGGIEPGEKAVDAAKRELFEETGLRPIRFWIAPKINAFYTPDNDAVNMVPVFAAEVAPEAEVVLSDEHIAHCWVSLKKAQKLLAWPGQREAAAIINEYVTVENNFLQFVEIPL